MSLTHHAAPRYTQANTRRQRVQYLTTTNTPCSSARPPVHGPSVAGCGNWARPQGLSLSASPPPSCWAATPAKETTSALGRWAGVCRWRGGAWKEKTLLTGRVRKGSAIAPTLLGSAFRAWRGKFSCLWSYLSVWLPFLRVSFFWLALCQWHIHFG